MCPWFLQQTDHFSKKCKFTGLVQVSFNAPQEQFKFLSD